MLTLLFCEQSGLKPPHHRGKGESLVPPPHTRGSGSPSETISCQGRFENTSRRGWINPRLHHSSGLTPPLSSKPTLPISSGLTPPLKQTQTRAPTQQRRTQRLTPPLTTTLTPRLSKGAGSKTLCLLIHGEASLSLSLTGARRKAWCPLTHAEACISPSRLHSSGLPLPPSPSPTPPSRFHLPHS
jgi:hypothetical protein